MSSRSLPFSQPSGAVVAQLGHDRVPSERVMSVISWLRLSRRKALFFNCVIPRHGKRVVVAGTNYFLNQGISLHRTVLGIVHMMAGGRPGSLANECRRTLEPRGRRRSNRFVVERRSGRILRCVLMLHGAENPVTKDMVISRKRKKRMIDTVYRIIIVVVIFDTN